MLCLPTINLFLKKKQLLVGYESSWSYHKSGHNHRQPMANVNSDSVPDSTPDSDAVIDSTPNSDSNPLFRPKSYFTPVISNPSLIAFCKKVDFDVKKVFDDHPRPTQKSNLSFSERKALKELSMNEDIIIRPADKGGAVVVLSKNKYILEATRHFTYFT